MRRSTGIPGDSFTGAAQGFGLTESSGCRGDGDDRSADDDRPLVEIGFGLSQSGFLSQKRRAGDNEKKEYYSKRFDELSHSFLLFGLMFFLMGHSSRDIDTGQEHKDKGLDDSGEDGDGHEREGEQEGDDRGDDQDEKLFGKDISEETDREGDRTGEMADDLDREEKRGKKRGGAGKMFEIFQYALGSDALPVVVDEDRERAAHGHVELAGRGHEPGDKTEKIAKEDKQPDCGHHGQVFPSLLSDNIPQQAIEKLDDELEEALALGRDDLQLSGAEPENENERHSHKQAHDDVIREEMLGMGDFDPEQRKEGSRRFTEDLVEEFDQE